MMHLPPELADLFAAFHKPYDIQLYLDSIPYVGEELNRCPLRLVRDRQAHCLDGGLLAAAALAHLGFLPRILDLVPEPGTDDDHVLAVFGQPGGWGALAKSNYAGLRFREPVYRTLRELAISYFEHYFNLRGEKTLRRYSRPVNLKRFDRIGWMTSEEDVWEIPEYLVDIHHTPLLTPEMERSLSRMDARLMAAGQVGTVK